MAKTNLLAFMTDAENGKYEAPKPTDEQLAAVLPWLIDSTITFARDHGYCEYVNEALPSILGRLGGKAVQKFYSANGFDCNGRDREGFNKDGYDRSGYNKEGFDSAGYDKQGYNKDGYNYRGFGRDGFSKDGRNKYGQTRLQVAEKLVKDWSPEYVALVKAKLEAAQAAKLAEQAAAEAPAEEPVVVETPPADPIVVDEMAASAA
jgi:hypothetical protein